LKTPILFLIFNRPAHTQKVFEQIRAAKPKRLFIAADGPRVGVETDRGNCKLTRSHVLEKIDWDCEVKTLLRDFNLGCGVACAEAITWFFDNVDEGIILEDDCLPDPSFFEWCSELLAYYRNDERIMHISGNNFQDGDKRGDGSYYFSAYHHNWGWATWRRSWSEFRYSITDFDRDRLSTYLQHYGFNKRERNFWIALFESPLETWDYQWGYAIWKNSGLCILPNENLVINIGFGPEATHTKLMHGGQMKYGKIDNLVHPGQIRLNKDADHYTFEHHFHVRDSFFRRLKNRLIRNSSVRMLYERTRDLRAGISHS
jgi:hypothetical protein